jgi:cytochrome c oxidase subunit 3
MGYYFTGAQSNVTTSFLYVLVLVHLAHLVAGLIVLLVVITNHRLGKYAVNPLGFSLAHTFWHFLGFLWVYLFLFLYFLR